MHLALGSGTTQRRYATAPRLPFSCPVLPHPIFLAATARNTLDRGCYLGASILASLLRHRREVSVNVTSVFHASDRFEVAGVAVHRSQRVGVIGCCGMKLWRFQFVRLVDNKWLGP